jgi:SAM-dependent methyltransferase
VENIYKNNQIADYNNQSIALLVQSAIKKIVKCDPSKPIKIIEAGAGTGGTSLSILKAIEKYATIHDVEYIYTDISPAFLEHGINNYKKNYDFVDFTAFDINKSPVRQNLQIDSANIIIASNVMHATSCIENSLLNLKILLKTNGLLVINEVTELQSFLTLTFGLTDSWWQYEDNENRIEGSPLVRKDKWKHLLRKCGFKNIKFFGNEETLTDVRSISGQTIIAAESDGINKVLIKKPKPHIDSLEKITHSYQDYVNWQSEMLSSNEGGQLYKYWKKQLNGELPVLNLPLDRPRPVLQTFSGDWIAFNLNDKLSKNLKNFARSNSVTLYSLLLSAYFILLHRYTGQNDLLVGCPTTGRPKKNFNGIVGDFVNTVVVRANCSGNPKITEFIGRTNRSLLDAIHHQQFPFPLLVERLNPMRAPNIPSIFQTMFVFQKPHNFSESIDMVTEFYSGKGKMNIYGYEFESFPIPQQTGQFDLSIEITGSEDLLKGVLKYNCDIFEN